MLSCKNGCSVIHQMQPLSDAAGLGLSPGSWAELPVRLMAVWLERAPGVPAGRLLLCDLVPVRTFVI